MGERSKRCCSDSVSLLPAKVNKHPSSLIEILMLLKRSTLGKKVAQDQICRKEARLVLTYWLAVPETSFLILLKALEDHV